MAGVPIDRVTVSELLRLCVAAFGDYEAVCSPSRGVRLTFAELDRRADRIAAACIAAGMRPGDAAVVWAVNIPDWIALQYGLARAGVVLVTANTSLKRDEVRHILRDSGAVAVFFGRGTKDHPFPAVLARLDHRDLPALRLRVALDGAEGASSVSFEGFLSGGDAVPATAVSQVERGLSRGDVINMQYTSGTTGFPKGVRLTHDNIVGNGAAIAQVLGYRPGDRLCLTVPLFHCFGCVIGTLCAHGSGVALVLNDEFNPDTTLDTIEGERCTAVYGVPTMFLAELEKHRQRRRDLSTLRVGVMAGALCPEALMRAIIDEFPLPGLVVAYGLTEASPGITMTRPDDPVDVRVATVGRPLPSVEVKLVDPATGEDVAAGTPGELWSRGPNNMEGYHRNPDATAAAITADGWLRTGDLAVESDDGNYTIVGRIKELIIRGGENISPGEVEDALRLHPAVLDAAAFAVPSDFYGEEVAAAVRTHPGAAVSVDDLREFLRERIADPKVPSRFLFVDAFPLTASGKVQRFRLAEIAAEAPDA